MSATSLAGLLVALLAAPAATTPVQAPRFEISASLGSTELTRKAGSYPRGFEPVSLSVQTRIAFALTPHLLSEFAVASTEKRKDTFEEELWDAPTHFDDVFLIHNYRVVTFSVAEIYQFESGRFRPFVGAGFGVDVDRNHDSREDFVEPSLTPAQRQSYAASGIGLTPVDLFPCVTSTSARGTSACGLPDPDQVTRRAYGFGTAGFKVYVSSRLFVVVQAAIGKRPTRTVSAGVGIRF